MFKRIIYLNVVVWLIAAIVACSANAAPVHHRKISLPGVVSHRGGTYYYPENTLPGLVAAANAGQIVETDVRWTSDDVAVLSHDPDTERVFNCKGGPYVIADTTWTVLKNNCRTKPELSLDENSVYYMVAYGTLLDSLGNIAGARVWPEIKVDQTHAENHLFIQRLMDNGLLSRAVLTSFDGQRLLDVRTVAFEDFNRVSAFYTLLYEAGQGVPAATAMGYQADYVGPSLFTISTPNFVDNNHVVGLKIAVYNTDTPDEWQTVTDLGTDFIITDHATACQNWERTL